MRNVQSALATFGRNFARTFGYMAPRRAQYCVSMFVLCASQFASAYVLSEYLARLSGAFAGGVQRILILSLIAWAAYVAVQALMMAAFYRMNEAFVADGMKLRLAVEEKVFRMRYDALESLGSAAAFTALQTDADSAMSIAGNSLQALLTVCLSGLGSLLTLFFASWEIALLVLAFGLLDIVLNAATARRMKPLEQEKRAAEEAAQAEIKNQMAARDYLKLLRATQAVQEKHSAIVHQQATIEKKLGGLNAFLGGFASLHGIVNSAGILALGLLLVAQGRVTLESVVFCLGMGGTAAGFFASVGAVFSGMQGALVGSGRLWQFMDLPDEDRREALPRVPVEQIQHLDIQNLHFCYPGARKDTLTGVDMHLRSGEMIALVGPSGGGKSTLIKLLLGLYDGYRGEIRLNGAEQKDMPLDSWRAAFAYVDQDTELLPCTVWENLLPDGADATGRAAASGALAQLQMASAVQTAGEGGTLSGGERQRIHILRALLSNQQLLLLDEPTSAQDPETEARILDALAGYARAGHIVLCITHSHALAQRADTVYFLNAGTIQFCGKHMDLLNRKIEYSQFWKKQAEKEVQR